MPDSSAEPPPRCKPPAARSENKLTVDEEHGDHPSKIRGANLAVRLGDTEQACIVNRLLHRNVRVKITSRTLLSQGPTGVHKILLEIEMPKSVPRNPQNFQAKDDRLQRHKCVRRIQ